MLKFRLAETLHMTVETLERNMSPDEMMHWVAFFRIRDREAKRRQRWRRHG